VELKKLSFKEKEPVSTIPLAGQKHLYLHVGDKVFHKNFRSWGGGIVIETWSSQLPGGMCYARVLFQDGKKRVFDNSYDSSLCCCYTGITLLDRMEL
jgi:hypothetical protein